MSDIRAEAIEQRLTPYIQHVLDSLLKPGELSHWHCEWLSGSATTRHLSAMVFAGNDVHQGSLFLEREDWVPEQGLDSFTDGFEDFVSESGFGWGQQRELTDRPRNP